MIGFDLRTAKRNELVEITDRVRYAVKSSRVRQGLCIVYCPHTTAAITINENADPDVVHEGAVPSAPKKTGENRQLARRLSIWFRTAGTQLT